MLFLKELILTVSTLGGCGGLERTDYLTVSTLEGYVLFLKELILTVASLGGCDALERTVFNSVYIWRVWWS